MSEEILKRDLAAIEQAEKTREEAIDIEWLVEALRSHARHSDAHESGSHPFHEAADTIERLRAQVKELQAKLK